MPEDRIALQTDVLVIGGGMAGGWAAIAAARAGAAVILVDKGYCGTSGVTATAGPGHWWVAPAARAEAIAARNLGAAGLGDAQWMAAVIDLTWRVLPTLASHYDFPRDEAGALQYRGLRGPEYLAALRRLALDLGVRVLDHWPALELLRASDGAIAGARGLQRQRGNAPWQIRAGAVVLATGGTSFRSHLLGAHNNTGDGYLMGAEAGATLSGMEFTAAYTVAPLRSNMTRTMSYAYASYTDAGGRALDIPAGPDNSRALARALLQGPVFCRFDRMPEQVRQWLPTISPNVMLPFDRWGIDPWRDRFEVTLHTDGTIRGTGGLRVTGADCGVGVPGLYAAGDAATRELVTGAISGGGAQNSAWALSSAHWAARAAADFALRRGPSASALQPLGQAGLRPAKNARAVDARQAIAAVQAQMHPYERNLFRTGAGLRASAQALESAWTELHDHGHAASDALRLREAAALTASARWSVAAALLRQESRGMHQREDLPASDARQARRLQVGGLERAWVSPDMQTPAAPPTTQDQPLASHP